MRHSMLSNFHTHTYLCKHADGVPIEYAEAAKGECSALGFSDHCPYPDSSWDYCRMAPSEIPLYKKLVEEARAFAGFPVYLGFECEWLPRFKNWYSCFLKEELQSDFLILGSHWFPLDGNLLYAPELGRKKLIFDYIDFTIEGLKSGIYDFLAHPDLFLAYTEELDADMISCSKALIDAATELNIPIEINGYGFFKSKITRHGKEEPLYPVTQFWEIARDKKAKIICNSDAHTPAHVILGCRKAQEFAEKMGITPLDFSEILKHNLSS